MMSFAGARWLIESNMAKWEIHNRTLSPIWNLRWKYWLKTKVVIKWPRGWAPLDESGEVHAESADPNTWYRWWLEKHVGRQGWAWDWKEIVGSSQYVSGYEHLFDDKLEIKFRNSKHATMFILKWVN